MIDDYAVLDRLDALVRKSLLTADRSTGQTRFSMLETIRQFAKEQLAASGDATDARTCTPDISLGARPTFWPCGTVPDNARSTPGSSPRPRICAAPFGGRPIRAISMSPPRRGIRGISRLYNGEL